MVKVFDKEQDEWTLCVVHQNRYHQKQNLIVLEWDKIDHSAYGKGEQYAVPQEAVRRIDRWEDILQPLNQF